MPSLVFHYPHTRYEKLGDAKPVNSIKINDVNHFASEDTQQDQKSVNIIMEVGVWGVLIHTTGPEICQYCYGGG